MGRLTNFIAAFFFATVSCALAQQPSLDQQNPEDAFQTRQLIAWSSLQKPQPAPQPLPPRDTPIPQPDQPPDQQAKAPGNSQTEQSPAESFTGKIVKDGAEYVLRAASNTTYHLDDQSDLQRFENQNVRVTGKLETGTNTIHVVKLELLS
jgi:Protein of unknown function (DUF5818)